MTRVLIADDSATFRRLIADALAQAGGFEVVGFARDGQEAVALARTLNPDVITMDVEMPQLSGIGALRILMAERPVPVVMCSTLTSEGTAATMEALEIGAVDFICKIGHGPGFDHLRHELPPKVLAASTARVHVTTARPVVARTPRRGTDAVILIAASTGGPRALTALFESLPANWQVPMLIVQHMPIGFTDALAQRLNRMGRLEVKEAKDGDSIQAGTALVAPGGLHMAVVADGQIRLIDDPPANGVKPAADILFTTAARHLGSRCVGAILTGMGRDGTRGAEAIKARGGVVFGEAASTCTVYGMPKAAHQAGFIDAEFPIHEMGQALVAATTSTRFAHAS